MEGNMSRANGALYPFGYGLSYTTFEYSDLKISPAIITPNQQTFVTCKVTNTGKRAGDEVVQLYVRDVLSSVTTYEKNLAGFERVHLQPGETKEVTFPIDRKALELLNADMHWVVEPGDFNTGFTDNRNISEQTRLDADYGESFLKSLEIIEKEERNGCHPQKLGAAICKIVERTNPPFRTKVGPWIQVLFAKSKKWLPDAVMQCALRIFYAIK